LLLVPLGIPLVYALDAAGLGPYVDREPNEWMAMPLIGLASVVFWAAAIRFRSESHLLLAVLTLGFFLREWHFVGTTQGVYVVILACAGWAALRRRELAASDELRHVRGWLVAALATYLLSQLVARRVFAAHHLNLLPNEDALHVSLEETLENVAHLMMLATAWIAWPRRWSGRDQAGPGT
jgi:hypothetical protein